MTEIRNNDPFTELVGPEGVVWQAIPEGPGLLQATAAVFQNMHPYAGRIMTQTSAGTYLSVDRRLHYQENTYPSPDETRALDGSDPYVYIFRRGMGSDNAWRTLPVQRTAGGAIIASAMQTMRWAKGELTSPLPLTMIAGEAQGVLRGLRMATSTTSEHAAQLTWPESQAAEALAFQGLVDALLAAKGLEVSDVGATRQAVISPRGVFPRPWALSSLIIGPSLQPRRCIPEAQIASTAVFDAGNQYSAAAIYDPDGGPLTVDLRYTRKNGKKWFMTPQERANAMHALINQLEPANVDVALRPL
ncbi:MAG TPA: hypothetical protein VLI54_06170 [Bacillota bacterium]|nr:hypothetical protein [Bacillota bacterium]